MNVPMTDPIAIIGFNGQPQVECGWSLPIAQRESDRTQCVFDVAEAHRPLRWHDPAEVEEFALSGRWTPLVEPLPFPRACCSETGGALIAQPMVVFAARAMLDAADEASWPVAFQNEPLEWRGVVGHPQFHATCVPAATAYALLGHWARRVKTRFDSMHNKPHMRERRLRAADLMLCAAVEPSLRWQGYLRYTLALEPEKVRRLFDGFIRHEFPGVTFDGLLEEMTKLKAVLDSQRPPVVASAVSTARSKVNRITQRPPIDVFEPTQRDAA